VASNVLKPPGAVARRALQREHSGAPLFLISLECGLKVVVAHLDACPEVVDIELAHPAVDAVAGDDKVGVRELGRVLDLASEPDVSAEIHRTLGQNVEQMIATYTEAVFGARKCSTGKPRKQWHRSQRSFIVSKMIEAAMSVRFLPY
jgi:hypothetical protein